MLVGSLSVVIYTFIGKNPEEVESLRAKNESLEKQLENLALEKDKVEKMLRDYQSEVREISNRRNNFNYKEINEFLKNLMPKIL